MMGKAIIRATGQGRLLEIGPTRNWVKHAAAESSGLAGALEIELGPGFPGPPPHRHLELDRLWYVVVGAVDIAVDRQRSANGPGAFAYVPRGIPHTFANPGAEWARLLEIDTPRTLDAYFTELAAAIPSGAAVNPVVIAGIQRRHDTTTARLSSRCRSSGGTEPIDTVPGYAAVCSLAIGEPGRSRPKGRAP